jgi:predicted acylesterase/phospholipase RssA
MMFRKKLSLLSLAAVLGFGGCGTIERPGVPLQIAPETITRVADPRISANDITKLEAFTADIQARLGNASRPLSILALSGGGANGAYGAGVVVGWTERGDRPVFDMVTGVSTGALAAPFAFLGPAWDDALRLAYVGGGTSGLLSARTLSAFRGPSLFNSSELRALIDASVTPELLREIAIEHAKGRKLLVATTNLDTQETVIWDMGLIAAQAEQAGAQMASMILFRDVLLASASIPGIFPPVLIAGLTAEGEVMQSMHVDGSVNTPFLAIPEDLLLWSNPQSRRSQGAVYVIVNGQVGRTNSVTPGRLDSILARTFDTMTKSSLRLSLAATAAFASRNGMQMSMTAIPDSLTASALRFDTRAMEVMFDIGKARAANGEAWSAVSPSGRPAPLLAAQDVPQVP